MKKVLSPRVRSRFLGLSKVMKLFFMLMKFILLINVKMLISRVNKSFENFKASSSI